MPVSTMQSPHSYPELSCALASLKTQTEFYRPTAFWDEASQKIVEELQEHGIENFRSLQNALNFFVPTYGTPGNAFSTAQVEFLRSVLKEGPPSAKKAQMGLDQFLSGWAAAHADFRVLAAADQPGKLPALHTFSESTVGKPVEHFEFEGRLYSRSALNYLLGLALLKRHLAPEESLRTILEIGGGFGTLGEILAGSGLAGCRYVDVDIPPTSYVAQYYLSEVVGQTNVSTYAQTRELEEIQIEGLRPVSVLCAWQIEKLRGQVDLFVNFISFQEMEPHVVQNYLRHVDRLRARWVLLRNMREGKQKRSAAHGVGVDTPILGDDYLAMLPRYELVERNVVPFGYRTVDGYHSELFLLRRKS
jgi:putative sugar O-methyltransferase